MDLVRCAASRDLAHTPLRFEEGAHRGTLVRVLGGMGMRVLVACEFSGIVRDAFRDTGHDAWSCDLLDTERPGQHYTQDVLEVLDKGWDLVIAHPPCDHLAVSGARWFPEKRADGRQQAAIEFFMQFVDCAPCVAIENPIGVMSTLYRKPDQIIQPWQFGHGEVKATCLWLKNLPKLVPTEIVDGRVPRVHHASPGPDRWKERSRTLEGIARAMASQWGCDVAHFSTANHNMT